MTYTRASDGAGGINETATDELGHPTVYHLSSAGEVDRVRLPGSTIDQVSLLRNNGRVAVVNGATGQWNYSYTDAGQLRTTVSTGPQGQQITVVSNLSIGRANSVTEAVTSSTSRTTGYLYDAQQRLQKITRPEGDSTTLGYDARGNVTSVTEAPKPGASPPPSIVTSAAYPTSCTAATIRTCNQPTSTTDPRNAITNYTYSTVHGGVESVTEPAPTTTAARPETRIAYATRQARYRNSPTTFTDGAPIYLPTQVSTCSSGIAPACIGSADEIRSTVTYGTIGLPNNLLPTSVISGAVSGSAIATTTTTYTANGDIETVDGPLTDQPDVTSYFYDNARQMVGMVGPDPDGTGPLRNRAMKMTYRPDGAVSVTEVGTTAGQTQAAFNGFVSLQQNTTLYDPFIRPTASRFTAAGTTHALAQQSYDASGRPDCTATRMNPFAFTAPPASACVASATWGYGPDRISRATYDRASQLLSMTSGLGTDSALTETVTYTLNGLPETLIDGDGNVSAMVYDRFDRLSRMRYPNATGTGSSTTDYDEYTYDAASNVLTSRTRSDQVFTASYDALNRPTAVTAPAPIAGQAATDSVAYTYDNLGRPLSATIPGTTPVTTAMTWDALGRMRTETGPLGTMTMDYDPAGRRTSMLWPDGFAVEYRYDVTNAMTRIQLSETLPIALYAYDDLGRRASVTRPNGVNTLYGYDPASRLTSLINDFPSAASDNTYIYQHNPAGQITGLSSANDAYAWPGPVTGTDNYGLDGLNRVTTVNGAPRTYDANSNLTNDGTRTFAYDAANRLRSTSTNNATLAYDALGRLRQLVGTAGARYIYEGDEIAGVAAGTGSTIGIKLVRGPWPDEVVVSYSGTTPTWSLQDHLGSTVALADTAGAAVAINAYDEYGVPKPGNGSRFQYTGQLWLQDFGLYHYKARAYHPGLGRFLQTDPIGYAAGANLYAYVGGDPVNWRDTLGLQETCPPNDPLCNTVVDVEEVVVTGERCSRRADFCLSPDDLEYIDVGLSFEIVFVGGFEIQRGYTYVIDVRGPVKREIGRCSYSSFTGAAGFGFGAGPTVSWDQGSPGMRERSMIGEISGPGASFGFEVASGGGVNESASFSGNPLDNFIGGLSRASGSARGRLGIGLKFGGQNKTRSNCQAYGSY